jgi:DNA replication protein DnaC
MATATEQPTEKGVELDQDDNDWIARSRCPRCRKPTEHRIAKAELPDGPSEQGLKLASILICGECETAEERDLEHKRQSDARSTRLKAAQLPLSLQGLRFEDMLHGSHRRDLAIVAAQKWSSKQKPLTPGLYLHGPAGVGKTRLAGTAAWARLTHSRIRWVSVAVLMAKLGAAWGDADRRQALQILIGRDPVVFDDFDKATPSDWQRQQLFVAIDERVQAGTPMIVTANSKLSELGDRFGEPIMSRLAGHCLQFELDGPDRRLEIPGVK